MSKIVITGSTRGIGRSLAERFIEIGWDVVINGRSAQTVNAVVQELNEKTGDRRCSGFPGDVTSVEDMSGLWDFAADDALIDVWINNAGIDQERRMLWDLEIESAKKVIDTNLMGSIIGTVTAIRGMTKQGRGTVYVMEGFGSNGMIRPRLSVYGTSKASIAYLAKSVRGELKAAESSVRMGTISPGMVMTDLLTRGLPDDEEESRKAQWVFNVLADSPDTVSDFICKRINGKRSLRIVWLTRFKVFARFATSFLRQNRFFP